MTLHINDASTWRTIAGVYVNDNGTWREIQEVYVNDNGTWRSVHVNDVITIEDFEASSIGSSGTRTALYRLASSGNIEATNGTNTVVDIGDWITPQNNMANYECRATMVSGILSSGTINAWQSLSVDRQWTVLRASPGSNQAIITVEIRRAIDAVVLDSATITLTAQDTA